ncbi:MAG: hypothetical protein R6V17_00090 [Halanaerobacter sp.]
MKPDTTKEKLINSDKDISPQDILRSLLDSSSYNQNIIISAKRVEIRNYDDNIYRGRRPNNTTSTKKKDSNDNEDDDSDNKKNNDWYQELSQEKRKEYYQRNNNRTRAKRIKDLYYSNTDRLKYFYTLTFGPADFKGLINNEDNDISSEELNSLEGITDLRKKQCPLNETLRTKVRDRLKEKFGLYSLIKNGNNSYNYPSQINRAVPRLLNTYIRNNEELSYDNANKAFQIFIRKIQQTKTIVESEEKFQYIAVFEKSKTGRVHIHMVANKNLSIYTRQLKWDNGSIDLKEIDDDDTTIDYLIKSYTTSSDQEDFDFFSGKKKYRTSQYLRRTQEITDRKEISIFLQIILDELEPSKEEYVEAKNEYGKSYNHKVYEFNALPILKAIRKLRARYFMYIVHYMKKNGLKEISFDLYSKMRKFYHKKLRKKLWQLSKTLKSKNTAA